MRLYLECCPSLNVLIPSTWCGGPVVLHCTTPKSGFHQPGHESLSTTSTTFRELDAAVVVVVVVDIDQVSVVSCFHHPDTRDLVSCFISTTNHGFTNSQIPNYFFCIVSVGMIFNFIDKHLKLCYAIICTHM